MHHGIAARCGMMRFAPAPTEATLCPCGAILEPNSHSLYEQHARTCQKLIPLRNSRHDAVRDVVADAWRTAQFPVQVEARLGAAAGQQRGDVLADDKDIDVSIVSRSKPAAPRGIRWLTVDSKEMHAACIAAAMLTEGPGQTLRQAISDGNEAYDAIDLLNARPHTAPSSLPSLTEPDDSLSLQAALAQRYGILNTEANTFLALKTQDGTFNDATSMWYGLKDTIDEAFGLMGASSDDCDSNSKRMLRVAVSDPRHAAHKFAHTLTQAAFGAGIRARETVKRNKGTLPCVLTPRGVVNKQSFRAACPDTCNDAARSSFNKFRPTFHARLSCVLLKGTRLFHARLAHNLRARAPEHLV